MAQQNPEHEPLFWNPVPWTYSEGMIWDASGDAIVSWDDAENPAYIDPEVGEAIVAAINEKFCKKEKESK